MLERDKGASVAEIGQRLGWLPHTVRAAITGLKLTRLRGARQAFNGGFSDARDASALFT